MAGILDVVSTGMDPNKLGDISELRAAAWLIENGWEVYRNVGCTGLADLVAFDPEGQVHRIDVKTLHVRAWGARAYKPLTTAQRAAGVRALYVGASEFIWGEDIPPRGRPRKSACTPCGE